jgi:dihydropteroate synthase
VTEANGSTTLHAAGRRLEFDGHSTHVMAVLNLSPESRVRHSVVGSPEEALERARAYRSLGASIIDLGAQSSHFENRELSADEEIGRMLPALRLLADDGFVVSVDTWKPEVARAALDAGAGIVNDTGGLQDPEMVEIVATTGAPVVVMYIEGRNPLAVGDLEFSTEKPRQVAEWFSSRIDELARDHGIRELILDPGLSINYRSDYEEYGRQQLREIRGLASLRALGHPVLVPVPRKADTHRMLAYLTLSLEYGADVIRVHDVEVACDLVKLFGRTAPPVG